MIPKLKYIATYQVSLVSAITQVAEIKTIEQFRETNKYIVYFTDPTERVADISLGKAKGKAPQSPRYSSRDRILSAKSLDSVF